MNDSLKNKIAKGVLGSALILACANNSVNAEIVSQNITVSPSHDGAWV